MHSIPEVLDELGWKIAKTAHGTRCVSCLVAAMNAVGEASSDGGSSRSFPGFAGPGQHHASITRKDTR